jgi:hypothetical protein
VPSPKGSKRTLIAVDRAPDDEKLVVHVQMIGHASR